MHSFTQVYNLGTSVTKTGPAYNIICFPHGENMFTDAHIVGTVPARWKLHPGYMHTFGRELFSSNELYNQSLIPCSSVLQVLPRIILS